MNKLDARPLTPSFAIPTASRSNPNHGRRLIVLFPPSELDDPNLPHRIWEIASSSQMNVLLLGLYDDFSEEAQLRRRLVTMAAIIKDSNFSTEIIIEHGHDWLGQVKHLLEPGDVVACHAGQKVGLMRKPLDQILRSSMETPVYILAGAQASKNSKPAFPSQVLPWFGSLAVIGGFFWVEMKLVQLPQDWAHTALLYLCIFVEVILIWLWNSLFV